MNLGRGERAVEIACVMILLFVAMATVYPFWHVLMYSLSDSREAMRGGLFLWPRKPTLTAFALMTQNRQLFVAYKNSILVTAVGTAVSLTLTAMTAYPLSVKRFAGRNFFVMLIFFTMLFSGGMIPLYLVVRDLHLLDRLWSLILPIAINAYNLFVLRNFFQSLPASLEESAHLDGANAFQVLARIVLPLSKPALAAIGLFYAVTRWNMYIDAVLYINDSAKTVLQLYLRGMLSADGLMGGQGSAAGTMADVLSEETVKMSIIVASVVPVLLTYPLLQRHYVKGIMIGSIKG